MDRSKVVTLLKPSYTQDTDGIWQETLTGRDVFCQVDSVTRNEFFEAGRNGLNPDFRITMFSYDYEDELLVRYNGKTYSVYRTYFDRNDIIELYVERTGGANGKVVTPVPLTLPTPEEDDDGDEGSQTG